MGDLYVQVNTTSVTYTQNDITQTFQLSPSDNNFANDKISLLTVTNMATRGEGGRETRDIYKDSGYFNLYYFKIYKGNNLIRNFVPILDVNHNPCLYEKVEKKIYYNEGSGNFGYPGHFIQI